MSPSGSASSGSEGGPSVPASGASTAGITTLGAGKRRGSDFEFQEGANDIVGIVMLEIQGADDLPPRLANSTFFLSFFFSL